MTASAKGSVRRRVFAALFIVMIASPLDARANRPEACFAINPVAPKCGYGPATVAGGIDAIGSWIVTIKRPVLRGHKLKTKTIVISSDHLAPQCVSVGPRTICPIGTILPRDTVAAEATEPISLVGVGNPCPVPNPGAPPPIAGGKC